MPERSMIPDVNNVLVVLKQTGLAYQKEKHKGLSEANLKEILETEHSYDSLLREDRELEDTRKWIGKFLKGRRIQYKLKDKTHMSISDFKDQDLIIAVGGDGTVLETAQMVREPTMVLGVNLKPEVSEGAHCSCTIDDLAESFERIQDKNCRIKRKTRLKTSITCPGKKPYYLPQLALNEVAIAERDFGDASRYRLFIDGEEEGEYQLSSGILIAPGAGSTAWIKNASKVSIGNIRELFKIYGMNPDMEIIKAISKKQESGIPFDPESNMMMYRVRECIEGIYSSNRIQGMTSSIKVLSEMRYEGIIRIDGSKMSSHRFDRGCIAEISRSDKPLRCVYFD